jgi:hypothetical protein
VYGRDLFISFGLYRISEPNGGINMKVLYVSGKYRDDRGPWYVKKNIEAAADVAIQLWQIGYCVICPHQNTAFFEGPIQDPRIIAGDCELVRRSDGIVMVPGWEESQGAKIEMYEAHKGQKPIFYWPWDGPELRRWFLDDYDIAQHVSRQIVPVTPKGNDAKVHEAARIGRAIQDGLGAPLSQAN